MKSHRFMLSIAVAALASAVAFAQNHADMQKEPAAKLDGHKSDMHKTAEAAPSEAQKSFNQLKTLAGNWEGPVSLDPPQPEMSDGKPLHVSMRVTSRGNALVHEMQEAGTPLDPAKYDHPVTMLYVDGDRLTLIHYCDAGNRPRMTGKVLADGKTVVFEFLDLSGGTEYGHMHHAVFTTIDDNHHTEDWTYMMPGDKPVRAHFDLKRAQ
jgi:hypothetical protein